jgi:hypothetical protein
MPVNMIDPTPNPLSGDPGDVISKAGRIRLTADALRNAIEQLRTLTNENVTISDAVDAVRVKAADAIGDIEKVEVRYRGAAEALSAYGSDLNGAHNRADGAIGAIEQNNRDARYWRDRFNTLEARALSGDSDATLADDLVEARARVSDYHENFQAAMGQYNRARQDKENAVHAAKSALHEAREAADLDDGFWDKVGAIAEAVYEWAQENLGPIIEGLRAVLRILKSIVDILALIVGVLSIFLPFLSPLAAALMLASIALAATIFLCSLALFALGRETLGQVFADLIDVVVGVVTAKLGGAFKPGALTGLSNVFSRTAAQADVGLLKVAFAIQSGATSNADTLASYGLDIGAELFKPGNLAPAVLGDLGKEMSEGAFDIKFDVFPESGSAGDFGPFSGGVDLTQSEVVDGIAKPVGTLLSGGISAPIIDFIDGVDDLRVAVS